MLGVRVKMFHVKHLRLIGEKNGKRSVVVLAFFGHIGFKSL